MGGAGDCLYLLGLQSRGLSCPLGVADRQCRDAEVHLCSFRLGRSPVVGVRLWLDVGVQKVRDSDLVVDCYLCN